VPKVSVTMTTYNGERFVKEQLQSLKNQTYPADEVVIFDDCSTDHTVGIIESFIKEFGLSWKLSVNKSNVGYIENFYNAIKAATGDIIFLCDQDDVWHLDKIEKIINVFQKQKDIQVLSTGFRKIDEYGRPLKTEHKPGYTNHGLIKGHIKRHCIKKIDFQCIFRINISPGCTVAFKNACKLIYINNATKNWCHDWELCIFGGMIDGLFFYNEELIDYRLHACNTIGLKENSLDNGNLYGRVELAQMEYKRTQLYMSQSLIDVMGDKNRILANKYWHFTSKRAEALRKNSILLWMKCILQPVTYMRAVRVRGAMGDLLYILTHLVRRQEAIND